MPMERRVLVAVFLSFLVLYAYQALVVPRREMFDVFFASLEADYHAALQRSGRNSSSSPSAQPRRGRRPRTAQGV